MLFVLRKWLRSHASYSKSSFDKPILIVCCLKSIHSWERKVSSLIVIIRRIFPVVRFLTTKRKISRKVWEGWCWHDFRWFADKPPINFLTYMESLDQGYKLRSWISRQSCSPIYISNLNSDSKITFIGYAIENKSLDLEDITFRSFIHARFSFVAVYITKSKIYSYWCFCCGFPLSMIMYYVLCTYFAVVKITATYWRFTDRINNRKLKHWSKHQL